jgi:hypothetical protein
MGLAIPKIKQGGAPVEPGSYTAICYGVIDMGHQDATDFNGKPEVQHQIRLLFELPDERMEDGRPKVKGKKMKLSVHEKATLRKAIQALIGRPLSDAEAVQVDLTTLVGKGCNVSIAPVKSGEGTYIESFSPLKKREIDTLPEPENKVVVYSTDEGHPPDELYDWLVEDILKSYEFRKGATDAQTRTGDGRKFDDPPSARTYEPAAASAATVDEDDEIPF